MKKIIFLLFFTFLFSQDLSFIYNSNQWKSLLHYDKKFLINDQNFYISKKRSLKDELFADIKAFENGTYECKFPARKLFIEKQLNIKFPIEKCPNLEIYEKKVPIDKIFLVFASENIKDPSSMMGHTFFKFEGIRNNHNYSHAISFYTLINTANPLKLIYENTIPGMKGLFVLRPYREVLYNYLLNENRNIWEYQLKLTPFQKKMIFYHTWELKGIKQKYYFTSYNCASVIFYILSSANPKLIDKKNLWITPLGLIKIVYKSHMIQKAEILPSDEWFIKLLENELSFDDIYKLKNDIISKNYANFRNLKKTKKNFYYITLAEVYMNYKRNNDKVLKQILKNYNFNYSLDLSKYKNPVKTPPERQIGISFFKDDNKYLNLSFLPASHTLNDNNREYFNESQLKIGYVSILINQNKILLNNFTIYNMINLIPYDILTNPISYNFNLTIDREYTSNTNKKLYFRVNAGIGYDVNIFTDINLFSLFNIGLRYNKKIDTIMYPKIGFLMYEIFHSKMQFYYEPIFKNQKFFYNKYYLSQNIFLKNNYTLFANVTKDKRTNLEIGIKKLF